MTVPAPLLAGHHHHHHHKHRPAATVAPAKPSKPSKPATPATPAAPKHHHRLPGLTGRKPSLTLQVTTAGHASHAGDRTAAAHAAGDPGDSIVDYKFEPATITVHVGDTITWTNNGKQPHTATASNGSFDTGTLKPGASGSHTFTSAGTFAYICSIHPFMHGSVVVQDSSSSNTGGGSGSGSGSSAGAGGSGSSGGGGSGGSSNPAASTASSSPTSSAGSTGSGTPSSTSSGSLPNTGLDLTGAVLIALGMIGSGVAIRRRLRQS